MVKAEFKKQLNDTKQLKAREQEAVAKGKEGLLAAAREKAVEGELREMRVRVEKLEYARLQAEQALKDEREEKNEREEALKESRAE